MKLITEVSHDLVLDESKKSKDSFIVGVYSSAEIKNNNGRKYKRGLLEREITKINDKVSKKTLWGELGHPPNPEINLDKIAILTTKLKWENNDVYGRGKILNTPMGKITKELVKEGNLGISSRGLGTVSEDGYVNEDFNLITWDIVSEPSNNPSWVKGIYEDKEWLSPDEEELKKEKLIDEMVEWYQKHLMNLSKNTIYSLWENGKIDWPRGK